MFLPFRVLTFCWVLMTAMSAFALDIDVIEALGMQEVWIKTSADVPKKIGTIEVLKKGAYLYHWGMATPEQAQRWNADGKISEELLAKLLKQSGRVGGGFYVSQNPIDSASYGNTLMVIELPSDTKVLRSVPNEGWIRWNELHTGLKQIGISAIGNDNAKEWMTVIEANALSKEFVASEEFIRKVQIKGVFHPKDIDGFFRRFLPGIEDVPHFKNMLKQSEALLADVDKGGVRGETALETILADGTWFMKKKAAEIAKMDSLTPSILAEFVRLPGAIYELLSSFDSSLPIYKHIVRAGLLAPSQEDRMVAMVATMKLDPYEASGMLQEAVKLSGANVPTDLPQFIQNMKNKGRWLPHPVCANIFSE